jgi:hypothetical protein
VSVPSNAVLTRARVARRVVALILVVAGVAACAMSVLNVTGGVLGDLRFATTLAFLILGPGWAAAGFLRRAPAAHVWLLTLGTGVAGRRCSRGRSWSAAATGSPPRRCTCSPP